MPAPVGYIHQLGSRDSPVTLGGTTYSISRSGVVAPSRMASCRAWRSASSQTRRLALSAASRLRRWAARFQRPMAAAIHSRWRTTRA